MFSAIYAYLINRIRSKFWEALKDINDINKFLWLIADTFNEVGSDLDKSRGVKFSQFVAFDFNNFVKDCCLVELGVAGPKFIGVMEKVGL